MKKVLVSLCLIATIGLFSFTLVTKRSIKSYKIGFAIKNMGLTVNGTLKNPKVNRFYFDKDSLNKSRIDVSIPVSTINTGTKKRDEHLQQKEYFNAAKYPNIRMRSKKFVKENSGTIRGYFYVTMKGVSKEVNFPVSVVTANGVTTFKGNFKLNRLNFGVGTSSLVLADDLKVQLNVKTN